VIVVYCPVEVSALGLSLVQSPTDCGVPNECDHKAPVGEGHDQESRGSAVEKGEEVF